MTTPRRQFASDNNAGLCPEALDAMAHVTAGHAPAYGNDDFTRQAEAAIREWFETDCDVFFLFNGTSSNALIMASMCNSYHAIISHRYSHLQSDECAAPGYFTGGAPMICFDGADGKLTPDAIADVLNQPANIHAAKPAAITLAQATEVGTLYTPDEIGALTSLARAHDLRVHMDGARFANALASANTTPAQITWQVGIDALSLGGTKNGMLVGDAVVFFDRHLAQDFAYRRKQAGQLASKMRFLAAPWSAMLGDGSFMRNAHHANAMAARLEAGLSTIAGVRFMFPRQSNAVFVALPPAIDAALKRDGWQFFARDGWGARLMCAWDTTEQDVDGFIASAQSA